MAMLAGCATPGPLHVYSVGSADTSRILDITAGTTHVPSFLEAGEQLTGVAYDPFTDHFFLRLAPGNRIRVVDRPARAIKREFATAEMADAGGGDLAVKPRDGHLFLLHASEPIVVELTRLGKYLRRIPLATLRAPAKGIAYDSARDRLLILGEDRRRVTVHALDGSRAGEFTLEHEVSGPIGFDAEKRELYAVRGDGAEIGVFDEAGRTLRTIREQAAFIDVGPRSFVRVF